MRRLFTLGLMILLVTGLIFGVSAGPTAASENPAEFFKKNVVTMLVGFTPGAGSDYGGRLLASYWTAATGGAMVVKNVLGGGGMVASNTMYVSKPDGLTIAFGNFGSSFVNPHLFREPAMKYDINKLNWLVGVFADPYAMLTSIKKPYRTVEDLKKAKGLKMAALVPSSPGAIFACFFADVLGLDARLITGYKGGAAMALAGAKGEVDLVTNPLGVALNSVREKFLHPPVVINDKKRSSFFPDTPTIHEVAVFTPEQEALYKLVNAASYVIRIAAAPPGVPKERIQYMRDAFAKIVKMKGFQRQCKMNFPLGPTPMLGEELDAFVADAASLDIAPVMKMVKKYLSIR